MQRESCTLRSIQFRDSVGALSRMSRIPHVARLLSGRAFPINVAETANASLDMTAAVVDAAPIPVERRREGGPSFLVVLGVFLPISLRSVAPTCCA